MARSQTQVRVLSVLITAAFLVALVYGTSSTLSSGDTWIALAAGRQIAEQGYDDFPKLDTFSYSYTGRQWTNQNWLSHLMIWWLYDRIFPAATVLFELGCVAGVGLLVIWATHLNGAGAGLGAIGAACVYVVGFNYYDIRPAMMSHVLAAAVHALLLAGTYRSKRWLWGIPLVLLVWGNAHGSFLFGFMILLVWLIGLVAERRPSLALRALMLGAVALVSTGLIVLVSPFGFENFTHPLLVLKSPRFREIIEWAPAYDFCVQFPPVGPFFAMLGGFVLIAVIFGISRWTAKGATQVMSGEVLIALLGIALGLYSRRFIPTAGFLATPLMAKCLALLIKRGLNVIQGITASVVLVSVLFFGGWRIAKGYGSFESAPLREGLFLRRVNIKNEPTDIVAFAKANGIAGRVFAQWDWAGYCMFAWPESTVFIDGRSQALYSEAMYTLYHAIEQMPPPASDTEIVKQGEQLDVLLTYPDTPTKLGAELLLMKRFEQPTVAIFTPLIASKRWVPLYANEIGMLLARREETDGPLKPVLEKYERLELDWPATMWGHFSKALAAQSISKPDFEAAITSYKQAIVDGSRVAFYEGIAQCYVQLGRTDELQQYLQSELQRLQKQRDSDDVRDSIRSIKRMLGMS